MLSNPVAKLINFVDRAAGIPPLRNSFTLVIDIITMVKQSQPLSQSKGSLKRVIKVSPKSVCLLAGESTTLARCNDCSPCFLKVGPVWPCCYCAFP